MDIEETVSLRPTVVQTVKQKNCLYIDGIGSLFWESILSVTCERLRVLPFRNGTHFIYSILYLAYNCLAQRASFIYELATGLAQILFMFVAVVCSSGKPLYRENCLSSVYLIVDSFMYGPARFRTPGDFNVKSMYILSNCTCTFHHPVHFLPSLTS